MKLNQLLPEEFFSDEKGEKQAETEITGVSDHSEKLAPQNLFILKCHTREEWEKRIKQAEDARVAAILTAAEYAPAKTKIPCFFSQDLSLTEAYVWEHFFGSAVKSLRLVGVTGTNGKTSTAKILTHLLNAAGIRCGYIGTLGAFFGDGERIDAESDTLTTPFAHRLHQIFYTMKQRGASWVVMEVSSHALAQGRVAGLRFDISIFTNLTQDHLDYHMTMEDYYLAKKKLFSQSRFAVINRDDSYGARLLREITLPKESVSLTQKGDFCPLSLHEKSTHSTQYLCRAPFGTFPVSYPLFGRFHVYNTLLAIAAATHIGVCPKDMQEGLKSLPFLKGRLEKIPLSADFSVIIDYAHTPDAMENAISAVRKYTKGKLYVLFGAGGERDKDKRPQMASIAQKLADHVYLTTDNPRTEPQENIFFDLLRGMDDGDNYTVISDRKEAILYALKRLHTDDTLLLLGKGHEEYLLIGKEKYPFSEREIVNAFWAEKQKEKL